MPSPGMAGSSRSSRSLSDRVRDVDAEARDPAVEPEAQDPLELRRDVGVPPVEVGLLAAKLWR